jgi:signal transduction histidine kinase
MDNWNELPDRDRVRRIRIVGRILDQSMSALQSMETQVVSNTDTLGRIGPALRTLAAKFRLLQCVSFEGDIDDFPFVDRRVAAALIQFGKEALQNAAKYGQLERNREHQIHARLDTDAQTATLTIEDHGVGLAQPPGPADFEALRAAIEPIGGAFDYVNRPAAGRGLRVVACVPLTFNALDSRLRRQQVRQERPDLRERSLS